jgi:hypothetical protein
LIFEVIEGRILPLPIGNQKPTIINRQSIRQPARAPRRPVFVILQARATAP